MSRYNNNNGPLTYDLGYLMKQLGIMVTAERNGQEYHYQPPQETGQMPQYNAEPETYDHTATDPNNYMHEQALRNMLEGMQK